MAAYAALLSVSHIIERINQPPPPPNSLDKTQLHSLSENVCFLQDFLERYRHDGSEEADELESRIRDAAHAAEDLIESHIVDQIAAGSSTSTHAQNMISSIDRLYEGLQKVIRDSLERYRHDGSEEADESRIRDAAHAAEDLIESHIVDQISAGSTTSTHSEKNISSIDHLYEGLEKVIQDLAFIREEAMAVKEKSGIINIQINTKSSVLPAASLLRSPSMVGFDDLLYEAMDKLTRGQLDRQLIPISGMGGMGKTTLARNLFKHQTVVQHFDVLAWVTISQEYNVPDILLKIINPENKVYGGDLSEYELGEVVYKRLWGRRYLIVMDDMWVIDVWNKVKRFFPDNHNGSRILITTRQSNVAFQLSKTLGFQMKYLNEDESWDLLCKNIFGEESCPLELEETGRKIANNCKGLPLSIVVIAGVLAKSLKTQEYWKYIAENLSSIVNLEDNALCLKILSMSYNILPVHLKSCFLYMGIFEEDNLIDMSSLINLWVIEGFLKPISGKSLEEIAKESLQDLIDRNLINKLESAEEYCGIHDLLRDVCIKQSEREKFYFVASQSEPNILQGTSNQRRIVVRRNTCHQTIQSLQAMPHLRSLIYDCDGDLPSLDSRMLRIVTSSRGIFYSKLNDSLEALFSQLINSRYLAFSIMNESNTRLIPSSLYLLWNVHTLKVRHHGVLVAACDIWKMKQLQHVEFSKLELPDPPHMEGQDDFVLGNLHTLMNIRNFRWSEEVVKRIPNIKKLGVWYGGIMEWSLSCFDNLHLLEIESLTCYFSPIMTNWSDLLQKHDFPLSIKELTLLGCGLYWEDITTKIGSLPLLQDLYLRQASTRGGKWETVEGGFLKLKYLVINHSDLECWISESEHFPVLERITLLGLEKLEKIPSDLGNIPTLKLIYIVKCSHSVVLSAKEIIDEQQELGNEDIRVIVYLEEDNEEVKSLQSPNFQVFYF